MNKISSAIVQHKKIIIFIFSLLVVASVFLRNFVSVNYNMVDYLPKEAKSTIAIQIMDTEFTSAMPNARVMIKNVSLTEATAYKKTLSKIDGVTNVLWLDDVIDLKIPLQMSDAVQIETFYKEGNALYTVTIQEGQEKQTCQAILDLIGDDNALAGDAPDLVSAQGAAVSEVLKAMAILLPIILIILFLSTTSWLEPLLFLFAIGVSILINMGTNVLLGEVSFVTNSVTPILQLACSLDYAIFLLHSFTEKRKKYNDPSVAMQSAIKESIVTVSSSAATTLFGFLALVFMNFGIGADLGINLAKGIVFSFLSVMIFLPAITLLFYRWIDKTTHRSFLPKLNGLFSVASKLFFPVALVLFITILPAFLGQQHTNFLYGNSTNTTSSRSGIDRKKIADAFEEQTLVALLVPRGEPAKEEALAHELEALDHVTNVTSYATMVGNAIPVDFLSKNITEQFYSKNYARIIIYTDTSAEGDVAFQTVDNIEQVASAYYGDDVYMAGQSANTNDMKKTVTRDTKVVNLVAIIAIFVILFLTFRSVALPFILLLSIELGIWLNLSIPYFEGAKISFMGYLVISSVQLGATVDYAILMTNHYLRKRTQYTKKEALKQAWIKSFEPVLVSASILSCAGFALYATSTNPVIYELGILFGRGALLSIVMVLLFLPALLSLCDTLIHKTTHQSNFYTD
ncbi:MAG: uncharacterized protein PWP24_990 [Clostridiales bacterium]|nr:uncharacterized protein [Clostridiales bacterium]